MLSHGLMTALFFALIGMIYGRTHTRDVRQLSGLMKVMPFLSVCYVIAGLANLGLPGLSGFVAEMTIFVGSFQNADVFHRTLTVLACSSIVITAVYILRLVGKILYGTCTDKHHLELTDATWDERVAVIDRKSTRLNSSHANISYAVFCLKKKKINTSRSATPCPRTTTLPSSSSA